MELDEQTARLMVEDGVIKQIEVSYCDNVFAWSGPTLQLKILPSHIIKE